MAVFGREMLLATCDVLHRDTCKHTLDSFTQCFSFLPMNSGILLGRAVLRLI